MDFQIILAYILCIASALICVIYGLVNWNKGSEDVSESDKNWVSEEKDIEHEFE